MRASRKGCALGQFERIFDSSTEHFRTAILATAGPASASEERLAELRAALGDARGDVDTALTALSRTPGVSVIPEEDQKKLTPDDRAAAVMIGDRPKHLIAIEA